MKTIENCVHKKFHEINGGNKYIYGEFALSFLFFKLICPAFIHPTKYNIELGVCIAFVMVSCAPTSHSVALTDPLHLQTNQ
jgi:hypothetical protein